MAATQSNVASLLAAAAARRPASTPAKPERPASELVWDSVSPDELPDDIREMFYAIGQARSAFEAAMVTLLDPPANLKLAFAYKRGLAIALAPKAKASSGLAGLAARISAVE